MAGGVTLNPKTLNPKPKPGCRILSGWRFYMRIGRLRRKSLEAASAEVPIKRIRV